MSAHDLLKRLALPDDAPQPAVDERYMHDCGCSFRFLSGVWQEHKVCDKHTAMRAQPWQEQPAQQETRL